MLHVPDAAIVMLSPLFRLMYFKYMSQKDYNYLFTHLGQKTDYHLMI